MISEWTRCLTWWYLSHLCNWHFQVGDHESGSPVILVALHFVFLA